MSCKEELGPGDDVDDVDGLIECKCGNISKEASEESYYMLSNGKEKYKLNKSLADKLTTEKKTFLLKKFSIQHTFFFSESCEIKI